MPSISNFCENIGCECANPGPQGPEGPAGPQGVPGPPLQVVQQVYRHEDGSLPEGTNPSIAIVVPSGKYLGGVALMGSATEAYNFSFGHVPIGSDGEFTLSYHSRPEPSPFPVGIPIRLDVLLFVYDAPQ